MKREKRKGKGKGKGKEEVCIKEHEGNTF